MKTWKLGIDGYVMQYMISGPRVEAFSSDEVAGDQLETEKILRRRISTKKPKQLSEYFSERLGDEKAGKKYLNNISLDLISPLGKPWCVYAPHNSCFIDTSDFYLTLQSIRLDAVTDIIVSEDMSVNARVWSYMSVGIYLRGLKVGDIAYPVYKPMQYVDVSLNLKKGSNRIYFVCESLGARDTRNILGMQIIENTSVREKISVKLPDDKIQDEVYDAEGFIANTRIVDDYIVFPDTAGENVILEIINNSPDYYRDRSRHTIDVKGKKKIEISKDIHSLRLSVNNNLFCISRIVEFAMHRNKKLNSNELIYDKDAVNKNLKRMYEDIASVKSLDRGRFGFGIMGVLARRHLSDIAQPVMKGENKYLPEEDRQILLDDIACIEKRVDCADFLICGFIRYIHNYDMDAELKDKLKKALLDFRYWMDEEGSDAMCFWSENHSLMFYSSAMFIGSMYKDDYFRRAGKKGWELYRDGKKRVLEWIRDIEDYGFEEFLSNVYMAVTFAALLNLVDYAEKDISLRAEKICDKLVRALCLQCFKKTLIAPMGRVYREALYPFAGNTQALINAIEPEAPYCFGEGWMAYLASSRYRFPEDCKSLMEAEIEKEYSTGNALVRLKKSRDYILSSVQSPREDDWERWKNIRLEEASQDIMRIQASHEYTKALNESFHGTTLFMPGTYGYQQQMWMAALGADAVLFVNHPGVTCEQSGMRPGYWNGNGVMPAVKQEGRELLCIYSIPDKTPIHFVHVYCPQERFDEKLHVRELSVKRSGEWLFLRKEEGYMAFWSSIAMQEWDEQIFKCEFRMMGCDIGCYVRMGSKDEDISFEAFCKKTMEMSPAFDIETKELTVKSGMALSYIEGDDKTQHVY